MSQPDAIVVGSGPNGLAAAILLARAGLAVTILEAEAVAGGGLRTEELTLPGFKHDVFSAVHPFAAASPFFSTLPLARHGLDWIEPPLALAHPLDDRPAGTLERDVDRTAAGLGADGARYRAVIGSLARDWPKLAPDALAPLHWPRHPVMLAAFGLVGARSFDGVARQFTEPATCAMLGGIAAHFVRPLSALGTAAPALLLAAAAHRVGWPIARGGSAQLAGALASYFKSLGGVIETGRRVRSLAELPPARATLLDIAPRALLEIANDRLPAGYRRQLERFRYGPGVFKVDWALDGPVPWRDEACRQAGTVHLGGSLAELNVSENAVARGEHPERPFVLTSQPSLFDATRAPEGKHVLWGYCHVPARSTVDMLPRIEAQLERFAPGFGDRVLARQVMTTAELERRNANIVGGDISQGANTLRQLFFRPAIRRNPYSTPLPGIYLCSASTPPGAGVHGMCGYHAARSALAEVFGIETEMVGQ